MSMSKATGNRLQATARTFVASDPIEFSSVVRLTTANPARALAVASRLSPVASLGDLT
jgi:hypothetical protein